ncbi:MAG: hypothetical protein M5U14_04000 [Acidimicrobiia bacterium]|nr:hypothetical protein [Acidimicrobiia bacterium]
MLLDVGRRPGGTGSARGLVSPCEFRRAVACAHRRDRAGRTMALRGLAPDGVLHLELGLPLPGRVLPGPIVRRPGTRGTLDVFTTPLPPAAARAAMHDEAREVLSASGGEVGYHLDAALDVTLVHVAVPHREGADVLRLLEACAVAELDRELVAAGLGALTPEEPRSDPGR